MPLIDKLLGPNYTKELVNGKWHFKAAPGSTGGFFNKGASSSSSNKPTTPPSNTTPAQWAYKPNPLDQAPNYNMGTAAQWTMVPPMQEWMQRPAQPGMPPMAPWQPPQLGQGWGQPAPIPPPQAPGSGLPTNAIPEKPVIPPNDRDKRRRVKRGENGRGEDTQGFTRQWARENGETAYQLWKNRDKRT